MRVPFDDLVQLGAETFPCTLKLLLKGKMNGPLLVADFRWKRARRERTLILVCSDVNLAPILGGGRLVERSQIHADYLIWRPDTGRIN